MVLALFAIVFFTTVSLVYNRSMWTQAEALDQTANVIQANQLAHSRLDQIDARLFSKQVAFKLVGWAGQTTSAFCVGTNLPVNIDVDSDSKIDFKFNLSYLRLYCDSLGVALATQPATIANADSLLFFSVKVTVTGTPGLKYPVYVSRLYTKTNLNL